MADKKSQRPRHLIQNFEDYRDFLHARYEDEKAQSAKRSYGFFARKSGISKSFLVLLFQKKRHLSLNLVSKISKAFDLNEFEGASLALMVCTAQIQEPAVKARFEKLICGLKFEHALLDGAWAPRTAEHPAQGGILPIVLGPLKNMEDLAQSAERVVQKMTPAFQRAGVEVIQGTLEKISGAAKVSLGKGKKRSEDEDDCVVNPFNPLAYQEFAAGHNIMAQAASEAYEHRPCVFYLSPLLVDDATQMEVVEELKRHNAKILQFRGKAKKATRLMLVASSMVKVLDLPI